MTILTIINVVICAMFATWCCVVLLTNDKTKCFSLKKYLDFVRVYVIWVIRLHHSKETFKP